MMSLSETSSCLAERLEENESRVSVAFVRLLVIVVFSVENMCSNLFLIYSEVCHIITCSWV